MPELKTICWSVGEIYHGRERIPLSAKIHLVRYVKDIMVYWHFVHVGTVNSACYPAEPSPFVLVGHYLTAFHLLVLIVSNI